MYFEFACAECGKKLKVRDENVGGKVRCPYCHHTQTVEPPPPPEPAPQEESFDFNFQEPSTPASPPVQLQTRPTRKTPAPAASSTSTHEQAVSATDVNLWATGLAGLAGFLVLYAILFPLWRMDTYVGGLFWNRGPIQFAETLCFTWSLAILVFKWRKLAMQRDSMLFDLLPSEISQQITPKSVDRFVKHIRQLPVKSGASFLVNRVLRGLEHFRVLRNSSEVADRMMTQSDIDANSVDSSYAHIKVFVWAIPILGFIGTVRGIGIAVASFSSTMNNLNDMSALQESFNDVTAGLSTAFDTTLLALVLSVLIMFPMTVLRKSELDLLNWVDEYCNENLLKRLKDERSVEPSTGTMDAKAVRAAVDAAIAGQVDKSVEAVNKLTERLSGLSQQQAAALTQLSKQTAQAQSDVGKSMNEASESLQKYFKAMEQGVASLNRVLSDLDGKQVVIETHSRGLFGLFRRRNGK